MSMVKTEKQVAHPHDAGYKHLLSSKKIFLELLKSFVKADWVDNIDEDSLNQMEGSFISPASYPEEVGNMISNLGETLKKAQQDARLKGWEQGKEEGIKEGIKEGLEQGSKLKQIEIAKNLLQQKLPLELIAQTTGMTIEEVENIALEL